MQLSRPKESSRLNTDKEIFVLVVMNQSEESTRDKGQGQTGKFPIMNERSNQDSLVTSVPFLQAFTDHSLSARHPGRGCAYKDKPYKALTKSGLTHLRYPRSPVQPMCRRLQKPSQDWQANKTDWRQISLGRSWLDYMTISKGVPWQVSRVTCPSLPWSGVQICGCYGNFV